MDNPEMLSLRELLVYKHGEKYVTIGGNMRLNALLDLEYQEAPCKIIPKDVSNEQLKAYILKDNASFGEWDFNLLANEWDEELLENSSITIPDYTDFNLDGFFDEEKQNPKKKKAVICPHCGKNIYEAEDTNKEETE